MLSSSYKKKCINFHKKLTEPLQLNVPPTHPTFKRGAKSLHRQHVADMLNTYTQHYS